MEYIVNTFWNKITTDPVAAMLAGFIGMSILLAIIKRLLRKKE